MKQIILVSIRLFFLALFITQPDLSRSQSNCVLLPPVINIDFGSGIVPVDPNISRPENYERVNNSCPQDGSYAIVQTTGDCFNGHWITLSEDHTANSYGKMMLVNAAYKRGVFFATELKGLFPGTRYELAIWIVNVCRPGFDCTSNRPDLRFTIENTSGKEVARFSTGEIQPTGRATWLQYAAMFSTPAEPGTLLLKITNKEEGGCGNDFAMDDITVRECMIPKPVVKEEPTPKPVVKSTPVVTRKPVIKKVPPPTTPLKKDITPVTKLPVESKPVIAAPGIKENPNISIPKPILTRANPVVKQIETDSAEIRIDLYDNGEIDGDTVTIYHNNVLIVSRAGLSEKPISFHFAVDPAHPHHELVMVANNLGSIPPNTSLMIVTAKKKRYEVFISSTEQKNAKIIIDLKE